MPSGWATRAASRSTTRPTRIRLVKRCIDDLDIDPKRFPPRASSARSPTPRTGCSTPRPTGSRSAPSSSRPPPRSTSSTSSGRRGMNAMDFDDLLFRLVNLFELFPEVRDRYRRASDTCWSTSTRTPTTRSTAGCGCSARSTATCSWSATTISRSTASAARTSATSSSSRTTSPTPRSSSSSRTTARRRRSWTPPTR